MSFVDRLLQIARRDVGVTEDPVGSNWGTDDHPRVRDMIRRAGYTEPVFWCDCAVFTWSDEACVSLGLKNPMPRTGDCDLTLAKARKAGLVVTDPRPGDQFFVMAEQSDAIHTGLVEKPLTDELIQTIEGNSNTDGSRNGYLVASRRRRSHGLVFVRWADAVDPGWHLEIGSKTIPLILVDGSNTAPVRKVIEALGLNAGLLAYDPESYGVTYDGKLIPARAQVREGASYIPVRALAQFMGLGLAVDSAAKTVSFAKS